MHVSLRRCAQSLAKLASVRELLSSVAQEEPVQINAWIKSIRRQKHVSFVNLNDGSNDDGIQAVISNSLLESSGEAAIAGLQTGASVSFTGRLTEKKGGRQTTSALSPKSNVELQVDDVKLIGECDGAVSCSAVNLTAPLLMLYGRPTPYRRRIIRHLFYDAMHTFEAGLP